MHISRLSDRSKAVAARGQTDNAVSAAHEWCRDALLNWPQTREAEGVPIERLHLALAGLCRALSNALQNEREAAQECVRRVAEILQMDGDAPDPPDEFGLPRAGETLRLRGGLAPW